MASVVRSYTKFVMDVSLGRRLTLSGMFTLMLTASLLLQIGVGLLMYPFMLVADVMAVNNCG